MKRFSTSPVRFGCMVTPKRIGHKIKSAIQDELNLTASVGIAPLKFVAKIASDLNKPDGFLVVGATEVLSFLDPLPIAKLWGVGRVGQQKLERIGIHRVGDIRRRQMDDMRRHFGSWGEHLWRLANGIDSREVVPDHTAKQISHERTFSDDITATKKCCERWFVTFANRSRDDYDAVKRQARNVSIKYRREDFRTFSRSTTLKEPSDSTTRNTKCRVRDACGDAMPAAASGSIDRCLCRIAHR